MKIADKTYYTLRQWVDEKGYPGYKTLMRYAQQRQKRGMQKVFLKFGSRWLICEEEFLAYLEGRPSARGT